ncbi:hypothetical protein M758_9G021400 [Ceratodon purpureus]|nr:hypothetical protein M758_9G021400 [Ceratodon purpureus]
MMGRGAEGGSRLLVGCSNVTGSGAGMDIYSQVLKEVAPDDGFRDNPEHRGGLSFPLAVGSYTWKGHGIFDCKRKNRAKKTQPRSRESRPVGKQKHKQRHDGDDLPAAGDATAGQFWTQMDDYFRDVTTSDVQLLLPTTVLPLSGSDSVSDTCLLIPPVGRHYTEKWAEEDLQQTDTTPEQVGPRPKRKLPPSGSISKKSKKSGELITIISPPLEHEDGEELCHVCNSGDSDESNQILFCDICNVAVHQDCYGVRLVPEGQWLCSWCSWKASKKAESSTAECVLCPSKGGALKPVVEVDSKETVGRKGTKFAHLFCSQWVPETFIGNMEVMEPIRNVDGVRDERWRLLCSICKEKHGACIQCSHGMCAIAFHPLCAREAKFYMEVCSMEDSDDIEYRAYCSRHSAAHMGKISVALNEGVDTGASQLKPTDHAEEFGDVGAPTGTRLTENKTSVTNISSKEQTLPSASVLCPQFVDDAKVSAGQPQRGSSNPDDASQILSPLYPSGPSGEGSDHLQLAHGQQQGFEQRTPLAASPFSQFREGSRSPRSDNVNRTKQETASSNFKFSDKIEGESSLPKSGDLLDRRVSDTASVGSKGQDAFGMGGGDPSGEVAIVWDEKGSEERRQRGLSGEASTSHFNSTSLCDSPDVPAQNSNFPSSNEPHGKEPLDPTTGFEVSKKLSPTGAVHLDIQHRDRLQTDIPQPFAHLQIVQRLREYQEISGTNRQLLDTDHPANPQKSSRSPVRGVEDDASESLEKQWEQLRAAEKEGVLKLAPDDEIEGEILVLQNSLLSCAEENRLHCERLIRKLMPKLPEERASSLRRIQELSFVHRYMSQKREAKKLGRKEKRNKEAQAVLAAATAAAAASPRVGYIKRDALSLSDTDNQPSSPSQEIAFGHNSGGLSSSIRYLKPPVPRLGYISGTSPHLPLLSARSGYQARTGTELAALRTGHGHLQLAGEEPACDVCNIRESSRANKIVACNSCKVNVHQECYGIGRVPPGLWFCQPCAELQRQSQSLRSPGLGVQANILWAQCALCCRGAGALKRSTDGRWVHVFCAQWMPETSTGKDHSSLIQGMENMNPERFALLCSVCQRQEGACLTCNFGHCHGAFHPPCARDAGLYMTVRVSAGGRLQYRAYCDRHSTVQRAKVEQRQRSGNEELHTLRQIRVEFERVRLMCERICRRERVKRDILQVTKDIALGQLLSTAYLDMINLEQASEPTGINRGDTSTIEKELSLASIQQIAMLQHHNSVTDTNPNDEAKEHTRRHKKMKKHGRTRLHREQLMTPMEASILNMRLPKGYAYVPVDVYVKGTITPTQPDPIEKEQQLPPALLPP